MLFVLIAQCPEIRDPAKAIVADLANHGIRWLQLYQVQQYVHDMGCTFYVSCNDKHFIVQHNHDFHYFNVTFDNVSQYCVDSYYGCECFLLPFSRSPLATKSTTHHTDRCWV